MSFNANFDVEKYRKDYESDEHWELRKKFMLTHKERFPEDKLVSLAQTFYNIEFLGCTYPKQTMELIAELSKDIAAEHCKKRQSRLQRTFVKASDAAQSKAKAPWRKIDVPKTSMFVKTARLETDVSSTSRFHQNLQLEADVPGTSRFHQDFQFPTDIQSTSRFHQKLKFETPTSTSKPSTQNIKVVATSAPSSGPSTSFSMENKQTNNNLLVSFQSGTSELGLPLDFVILTDAKVFAPSQILENSTRLACLRLNFTSEDISDEFKCIIQIDGISIAEHLAPTIKASKKQAMIMAVNTLKKHHFTLEKKCSFVPGAVLNKSCVGADDTPLPDNNVGLKMMLKMGWTGSGLGLSQQGIMAPVKASTKFINRSGLGTDNLQQNPDALRKTYYNIVRNFSICESEEDLVFSSDLSQMERKILHQISYKFRLKSQSFGKNENRFIVISKPLNPRVLVYDMLSSGQWETEKYKLFKPENL